MASPKWITENGFRRGTLKNAFLGQIQKSQIREIVQALYGST